MLTEHSGHFLSDIFVIFDKTITQTTFVWQQAIFSFFFENTNGSMFIIIYHM